MLIKRWSYANRIRLAAQRLGPLWEVRKLSSHPSDGPEFILLPT